MSQKIQHHPVVEHIFFSRKLIFNSSLNAFVAYTHVYKRMTLNNSLYTNNADTRKNVTSKKRNMIVTPNCMLFGSAETDHFFNQFRISSDNCLFHQRTLKKLDQKYFCALPNVEYSSIFGQKKVNTFRTSIGVTCSLKALCFSSLRVCLEFFDSGPLGSA